MARGQLCWGEVRTIVACRHRDRNGRPTFQGVNLPNVEQGVHALLTNSLRPTTSRFSTLPRALPAPSKSKEEKDWQENGKCSQDAGGQVTQGCKHFHAEPS